MALIKVGSDQWIDDNELSFNFIRASGPGGQEVNKVSTSFQLSFDSPFLHAHRTIALYLRRILLS